MPIYKSFGGQFLGSYNYVYKNESISLDLYLCKGMDEEKWLVLRYGNSIFDAAMKTLTITKSRMKSNGWKHKSRYNKCFIEAYHRADRFLNRRYKYKELL